MKKQGRDFQSDAFDILQSHRDILDLISLQVVDLLSERMKVCMRIAELKALHKIAMMQPGRVSYVIDMVREKSKTVGLRPEYIESLFKIIISETCSQESLLINQCISQGRAHENTVG
ncbi:chorismate mutase [Pseudomonas sp.]|uniref:chorismate mutase n=1 Tax=Pseudomonas sp. TaxID=306 RepID=UPI00326556B4